jgi:hypothetical protein
MASIKPADVDGAKNGAVGKRRVPIRGKVAPKLPPVHHASICSGPRSEPLPAAFVDTIAKLESELGMDVWLLIQGDDDNDHAAFASINVEMLDAFRAHKKQMPQKEIALIIDSPGGDADAAYQLAMLLRRRCGGFTAIVPRWAKSAATLLSLAGKAIYLGDDGQLGALDAQVMDRDKEEKYVSALDDVGAIEELEERAMEAAVASLFFMQQRTKKKLNVLMPYVFDFVAKLHQPLFDKIDSIRFSRMCRTLSVAEKYAIMLLQPRFSEQEAGRIARDLVKTFPSHRFAIDIEHARKISPRHKDAPILVSPPPDRIRPIMDDLYPMLGGSFKAIGRIQEVSHEEQISS